MENEVYADLLFLVNFSMDFLCFYLCARFLHRPLSLARGVLASALGGVYAVVVLFLTVGKVPAFILDLAVCFLLCVIALAGKGERFGSLVRLCGLYLLISMLLGGIMTALFAQLNRVPGLTDSVAKEGFSTWLFFGIALLSALLTTLWGRYFRKAALRQEVEMCIEEKGSVVTLKAFCDSGNLLRDPISGKAVIPTEVLCLRRIVPTPILRAATAPHMADAVAQLSDELARRIRLVPARSATGEKLLLAWQPEHIYLKDKGGLHEISALLAPMHLEEKKRGIMALMPQELTP